MKQAAARASHRVGGVTILGGGNPAVARGTPRRAFPTGVLLALLLATVARGDMVEFLSGAKANGTYISKTETHITFRIVLGNRSLTRQYPLDKIHAVTLGENRYVVNAKTDAAAKPKPSKEPGPKSSTSPKPNTRPAIGTSRRDIESRIDSLGAAPPDWYQATPLDYPQSLDLSWPDPPPKGWNNQKNVGQYIWDVINPNPSRWRSGARLMHHLLSVNKDRPEARQLVMNSLGRIYHDLLEDYPRAAFWWRKAGVDQPSAKFGHSAVHLAACYWRMGNKQMAMELLAKIPHHQSKIKLYGDVGETKMALQLAEAYARGGRPDLAYLMAGDACRVAGQFRQAKGFYQQVLAYKPANQQKVKQAKPFVDRARANVQAIDLIELFNLRKVAEGTHEADSLGYNGPVHVAVQVAGGRIESVKITKHEEKQFYSALSDTTSKIIAKQSVKGIDATSSATITSEAIINAAAKALGKGVK